MDTKYQVISIGAQHAFHGEIIQSFEKHLSELGVKNTSIVQLDATNFYTTYKRNAPAFCMYFGKKRDHQHIDILKTLQQDGTLILPIVGDLTAFHAFVPKNLHHINGFELAAKTDIERLVSILLEGLGLLRLSRRLFISYKRNESSTVAIQLYEQFEKNGFDVFLDTHSVRPGEPFQDELWHRMTDTDILILLNTPGFLNGDWTTEELAQANTLSIGILQLIWPTHRLERDAEISIPIQLTEDDFGEKLYSDSKSYLTDASIEHIVSQAESLRARSFAARQDNIITEFISSAKHEKKEVYLQAEKFISVKRSSGTESIVIPTVGVPQSFTYNQSEELVKIIKEENVSEVFLLYDHRNIRDRWLNHLAWLDNYLPVKTIKIVEARKWLKKA